MIKLSVNINKIATIRNARGGVIPDVLEAAINCEAFGADGITVHPRPDERHITYKDVNDIADCYQTEFNVEGYPNDSFLELVLQVKPSQVTLVPDPPDAITSNAGWDCKQHFEFLKEVISSLHAQNIRTSIFVETNLDNIDWAKKTGTDRIEFYTESYAQGYIVNKEAAVLPFARAAKHASDLGLEINAGHDLNLENLAFFAQNVPNLKEVSIGHALVSDALYLGLENTIGLYKNCLSK
jgi:pyridoxine 5-phosphate synthase